MFLLKFSTEFNNVNVKTKSHTQEKKSQKKNTQVNYYISEMPKAETTRDWKALRSIADSSLSCTAERHAPWTQSPTVTGLLFLESAGFPISNGYPGYIMLVYI